MSTISIVIPVFNQAGFTEGCLSSVFKHTAQAKEITIIDNHSTDRTPRLLREFKAQCKRHPNRRQVIRKIIFGWKRMQIARTSMFKITATTPFPPRPR